MKKIIAIISGSLVAILLAVTIVLACTKFTADTIVTYNNVWAMEVYNPYHDSTDPLTLNKDSETFKEIIKLYKESLQENNLSALFQGAKGFDVEAPENKEVTIKNILDNEDGVYVVCLMYEDAQKLVVNGEEFVNPNSKTQEVVTYEKLYVQVCRTLPDDSDREIDNLKLIKDNYPKYVVTMDSLVCGNVDGIQIVHIKDFLLMKFL